MTLRVAESILDLIGQTPLLHLSRFIPEGSGDVYAKLEWFNPGGSVKDRAALGMILDAEERGLLKPGSTIIEPTAGNTGMNAAADQSKRRLDRSVKGSTQRMATVPAAMTKLAMWLINIKKSSTARSAARLKFISSRQ